MSNANDRGVSKTPFPLRGTSPKRGSEKAPPSLPSPLMYKGGRRGFALSRLPPFQGWSGAVLLNSPVGCELRRDMRRGLADSVTAVPAAVTEGRGGGSFPLTARGGVPPPKPQGSQKILQSKIFWEKERPAFKATVLRSRKTAQTAQCRDAVPYGNLIVLANNASEANSIDAQSTFARTFLFEAPRDSSLRSE